MKHLILTAALALLPAAALAQDPPAPPAAGAPLPKCSAKITDSCDQSMTTEKNALDHYPADTRDAGNNKIGAAPTMHTPKRHVRKSIVTKPTEATMEEAPK